MYLSLYWSASTSVSMSRNPQKNVALKFILTSPTMSSMSCSSYLHSFMMDLFDCLFVFYGISTFVGYLMPNVFFIQINSYITNNSF